MSDLIRGIDVLRAKYMEAAHRVQSGLAYLLEKGETRFEPKHMRVGIDLSKSDHAALAGLLIRKGLITESEYAEALLEGVTAEGDRLEAEISNHLGAQIKLW